MNPYQAYRRQEPSTGWTRIDVLLALYDGAIDRLEKGEAELTSGNSTDGLSHVVKAQLMVMALITGVRTDIDEELSVNYLRLYEYIVRLMADPKIQNLRDARNLLCTLRKGFEAIREEAVHLERTGQLQAAESLQLVSVTA